MIKLFIVQYTLYLMKKDNKIYHSYIEWENQIKNLASFWIDIIHKYILYLSFISHSCHLTLGVHKQTFKFVYNWTNRHTWPMWHSTRQFVSHMMSYVYYVAYIELMCLLVQLSTNLSDYLCTPKVWGYKYEMRSS